MTKTKEELAIEDIKEVMGGEFGTRLEAYWKAQWFTALCEAFERGYEAGQLNAIQTLQQEQKKFMLGFGYNKTKEK
jgi:hypothetical protein